MRMNKYSRLFRVVEVAKEMHGIVISYPTHTVIRRQGDNPSIGFMRALQEIAGEGNLEALCRVAPRQRDKLGEVFSSMQFDDQLFRVATQLKRSPNDHSALIINSANNITNFPIVSLQFYVLDHTVHCIMTLSNVNIVDELPNAFIYASMLSDVIAGIGGYYTDGTVTAHIGRLYSRHNGSVIRFDDRWIYDSVAEELCMADYVKWARTIIADTELIELCGYFNVRRV